MYYYSASYKEAYALRNGLKKKGIDSKVTKRRWNEIYHTITVNPGNPAITRDHVWDTCRKLNLQGVFSFN